jgi:glycosyltransferase involved in cell wall biosynthesis
MPGTRGPGLESVVNDGSEYRVGSYDELFAGLQDLLASEELRPSLGAAGRLQGESFDWDHIAGRWAAIFLKLTRRIG